MAPELTGHGLPLSKCAAYDRVCGQPFESHSLLAGVAGGLPTVARPVRRTGPHEM